MVIPSRRGIVRIRAIQIGVLPYEQLQLRSVICQQIPNIFIILGGISGKGRTVIIRIYSNITVPGLYHPSKPNQYVLPVSRLVVLLMKLYLGKTIPVNILGQTCPGNILKLVTTPGVETVSVSYRPVMGLNETHLPVSRSGFRGRVQIRVQLEQLVNRWILLVHQRHRVLDPGRSLGRRVRSAAPESITVPVIRSLLNTINSALENIVINIWGGTGIKLVSCVHLPGSVLDSKIVLVLLVQITITFSIIKSIAGLVERKWINLDILPLIHQQFLGHSCKESWQSGENQLLVHIIYVQINSISLTIRNQITGRAACVLQKVSHRKGHI